MSEIRNVIVYTDGACSRNPGPGGWAALLRCGEQEKEISGGSENTTNNRMELKAVVNALEALKHPCNVVIKTDSQYVVSGIMIHMHYWVKREWTKSNGDPVIHTDLWQRIYELAKKHHLYPMWIKAHADDPDNIRVDLLAKAAIPA